MLAVQYALQQTTLDHHASPDDSSRFQCLTVQGFLVNWGLERDIWAHALKASLRVDCSETGLVMTEPVFNFPQIQAATEEVCCEQQTREQQQLF